MKCFLRIVSQKKLLRQIHKGVFPSKGGEQKFPKFLLVPRALSAPMLTWICRSSWGRHQSAQIHKILDVPSQQCLAAAKIIFRIAEMLPVEKKAAIAIAAPIRSGLFLWKQIKANSQNGKRWNPHSKQDCETSPKFWAGFNIRVEPPGQGPGLLCTR